LKLTLDEYKEHFMAATVTIGNIPKFLNRLSLTVSPHFRGE